MGQEGTILVGPTALLPIGGEGGLGDDTQPWTASGRRRHIILQSGPGAGPMAVAATEGVQT